VVKWILTKNKQNKSISKYFLKKTLQ